MRIILCFLALAFLTFASAAPAQVIIYVDANVASSGDGLSWQTAKKTITEGLVTANDAGGGELWITDATYAEAIPLVSNIDLRGGFAGNETDPEQRDGFAKTTIDVETLPAPARPITGFGVRNVLVERLLLINGHDTEAMPHNGGGIFLQDVDETVVFDTTDINFNEAVDGGGVACVFGATPTFFNCALNQNSASDDGGGFYFSADSGGSLTLVSISSNEAGNYGGGIYTSVNSPFTLSGSSLGSNTAVDGGGGIAIRNSSATINDTFIGSNSISGSAVDGGGGILVFENATLKMTGGDIDSCRGGVSNDGGGINVLNSTVEIQDVNFIDNSASIGGGLAFNNATGFVRGSIITRSIAGGGSGISIQGSAPLISDCQIHTNDSTVGNAILMRGSRGIIEDTLIANHSEPNSSNAIDARDDSQTIFSRCRIIGNYSDSGSPIEISSSPLIFINSLFSGNGGDNSLIGFISGNSPVIVENCTFVDDTSGSGEGWRIDGSSGIVFRNSIFNSIGETTISLVNSAEVSLQSCLFSDAPTPFTGFTSPADLNNNPNYENNFFADPRFLATTKDQDEPSQPSARTFSIDEVTFRSYNFQNATTTLTSERFNFAEGELRNRSFYIPGFTEYQAILSNRPGEITLAGDVPAPQTNRKLVLLDFQIPVQSLAVDRGQDIQALSTEDIIKNARVVDVTGVGGTGNGAIDVGAYEFNGNTNPDITTENPVYVDWKATGAGDGTSWVNAYTSIQPAIDDARSTTDPIWIAAGRYGKIVVRQSRRLYGGFLPGDFSISDQNPEANETTIVPVVDVRGTVPDTLVYISEENNVLLDGLTFDSSQFQDVPMRGSAIYGDDINNLRINQCFFFENDSRDQGGAIYLSMASDTEITACRFENNNTTNNGEGGAIYILESTNVSIKTSVFEGNGQTATNSGGAIYAMNVIPLNIETTAFIRNGGGNEGGAISAEGSTVNMSICSFINNVARNGGAIDLFEASSTITQVDFIRNYAEDRGLAIHFVGIDPSDDSINIQRSRFIGNQRDPRNTQGTVIGTISVTNGSHFITNSTFEGNNGNSDTSGIGVLEAARVTIHSSNFIKNGESNQGADLFFVEETGDLTIYNSIFDANPIVLIDRNFSSTVSVLNSLFGEYVQPLYEDGMTPISDVAELNALSGSSGNISGPPRFLHETLPFYTGLWDSNDIGDITSTYIIEDADFVPGSLIGKSVTFRSDGRLIHDVIVANTETTFSVFGEFSGDQNRAYQINDFRLAEESLAIDAGTAAGAPSIDISGAPRPVDIPTIDNGVPGGLYDIGAYERQDTSLQFPNPDVIYVRQEDVSNPDGRSWATAYASIPDAIEDPDSVMKPIWVEQGTYRLPVVMESNRDLIGGFRLGDRSMTSRNPKAITTVDVSPTGRGTPPASHVLSAQNISNIYVDRFQFVGGNAMGPALIDEYGGGLLLENVLGINVFRECRFDDSEAVFGGGAAIIDSSVRIIDSSFSSNGASDRGGQIYAEGNSDIFLDNPYFVGGFSQATGGSVLYMSDNSEIFVRGGTFEAHATAGIGAMALIQGGSLTIDGTFLSFGSATDGGGMIAQTDGFLSMKNFSMFNGNANNANSSKGGGILQLGGTAEIMDGIISQCTAFLGSGIYTENASMALENIRFYDYSSPEALIASDNSTLTMSSVEINDVSARIFDIKDSTTTIDKSIIAANSAPPGAGMLFDRGSLAMTNTIISGNKVDDGSSLLEFSGTETTIINSTLASNSGLTSTLIGFKDQTNLNISNTIFAFNGMRALNQLSGNPSLSVSDSIFFDNAIDFRISVTSTNYSGAGNLNALAAFTDIDDGSPEFIFDSSYVVEALVQNVSNNQYTVSIPNSFYDISDFRDAYVSPNSDDANQVRVESTTTDRLRLNPLGFQMNVNDTLRIVDYRPGIGSSALDTANPSTATDEDVEMQSRPNPIVATGQNPGYDIGAHEFYPQEVRVTPASLDFGSVAVTNTQYVEITNIGGLPVEFTGTRVDIISDTSSSFEIVSPPLPDLPPFTFFRVFVRFTPTSNGPHSATLLITSDDPVRPNITVQLTGTGTAANPEKAEVLYHLLGIDYNNTLDLNNDGIIDASDLE